MKKQYNYLSHTHLINVLNKAQLKQLVGLVQHQMLNSIYRSTNKNRLEGAQQQFCYDFVYFFQQEVESKMTWVIKTENKEDKTLLSNSMGAIPLLVAFLWESVHSPFKWFCWG